MPQSVTTKIPNFDEKSENFEIFEDLFQKRPKNYNQLTKEDKIHFFYPSRKIGENSQSVPWKMLKSQLMATAKHIFQQPVLKPANQKLIDFLDKTPVFRKTSIRRCCPGDYWKIHRCQNATLSGEIDQLGSFVE